MAQRVLVFEKDTNFVRELHDGFRGAGVDLEVVRDPDAAIQRTRQGDVSMILLSIDAMETSGEAFLVCKRFKSDDDLAKVPFVIMGGVQHSESFESHKKLKKRKADEYVQLPASFHTLFEHVAPLLGLVSGPDNTQHVVADPEPPPEVNMIDDDISAFADNAFGDLVRKDEREARQQASEPAFVAALQHEPAASAIDAAELEQLRKRAEDAERRIEEAEERVRTAAREAQEAENRAAELEQRAVAAERSVSDVSQRAEDSERRVQEVEARLQETATRAEVAEKRVKEAAPPSGQMGISSRDYLDLREQLNRKDKELLTLRDEVTQRDRQLLDSSDRSLQLERVQAELHDNLFASQRHLEEAQTKIRAYEVDREAVTKRLEDFRGRLARSDEKGKKLEEELDGLKASSARELKELKAAHEQAVAAREQAAAAELERLRGVHLAEQSALSARAKRELADAQMAREHEVETLRASHERAFADQGAAHGSELETLKREAESALAAALAKAASERDDALEALGKDRAQELERRLDEAERAKAAAVATTERELEAKHTAERTQLEERHAAAESALQKKLADAISLSGVLSDRITEIEQAKHELDSKLNERIGKLDFELTRRTQERDTANNELSATRASIASLERTGVQLSERIAQLELSLNQASDRIEQQNTKIALDQELLDRVRRALGIGIGLLEQQKQNIL